MLTRREALIGIGVGLAGCGSDDGESKPSNPIQDGTGQPAPGPTSAPTGTTPPASTSPPASTTPPAPALTPEQLIAGIDHIVVLMMENRSFDHFLGSLKTDAAYAQSSNIEGLMGTESCPAPDGSSVTVHKLTSFETPDLPHDWDPMHASYNNGKNDGFVIQHAGADQADAMGFFDRSQLPLYYWLADNFTVCDHWFSSVLGPTWPNRFYLHATTSGGKKDNTPFVFGAPDTIWDRLKSKSLTYKNYGAGTVTWYLGGFAGKLLSLNPTAKIDDFFSAAANGSLPSFSLIDPDFEASDDHPAHNVQRGQAFVASVYQALAQSPAWNKTLFIITYDESGGFFDHLPPPAAKDDNSDFAHEGFRVPSFVIGPTVKKGYVCKTTLEHSSVAATLKTRFDIASLSMRMDNANDITDCIDPLKVNAPAAPPTGMPTVAMTMTTALFDGVGEHSQPVLKDMLDRGEIQAVNSPNHQERIGAWLAHAERLGAVRIVR